MSLTALDKSSWLAIPRGARTTTHSCSSSGVNDSISALLEPARVAGMSNHSSCSWQTTSPERVSCNASVALQNNAARLGRERYGGCSALKQFWHQDEQSQARSVGSEQFSVLHGSSLRARRILWLCLHAFPRRRVSMETPELKKPGAKYTEKSWHRGRNRVLTLRSIRKQSLTVSKRESTLCISADMEIKNPSGVMCLVMSRIHVLPTEMLSKPTRMIASKVWVG